MDVEKFIRDSAAGGLSRTATAAALGMRFEKFCALLDAMEPLRWPAPGKSLDQRRHHEAMRGICLPSRRPSLEKARKARRQNALRTLHGVTGTVAELIAHFKSTADESSVYRRLRHGMTLEAALLTPPSPPSARRRMKITPAAPDREPLSAWEAVDLEVTDRAAQCM